MSDQKPQQSSKRSAPPQDAQQIVRRLQGEDGYDIFADRRPADDRERWLREYEENRQ